MKIAMMRANFKSGWLTPPLGIGYLASYLKKNNHDALIIDALRDNLSNKQILKIMRDNGINVAGISCLSFVYNETVILSRYLKDNGITVIIGGVHPTFMPRRTLVDTNADFVVCGEGEIPLLALMNNGMNRFAPPPPDGADGTGRIKGVYALADLPDDDTPVEKADVIQNLDDIPYPDHEQMPPALYPMSHGFFFKKLPVGTVIASRGCANACKFCASPAFYGRRVRFRSPENVIAEIEHLKERYGAKEFIFEDDNLILKRAFIEKLCRLMIEKKLDLAWGCPAGIRADMVDEDLAKLMYAAGCYAVSLGIETSDDAILKNVNKGESAEDCLRAIDILRRNHIQTAGFFILGLPGETKKTLEDTIRFALNSGLDRAMFGLFQVLPGCEFYRELKIPYDPKKFGASFNGCQYVPEGLSGEYLAQKRSEATRKFYLRPKILIRLLLMIKPVQIKFFIRYTLLYRIRRDLKG